MASQSNYIAREANTDGSIYYTDEEHARWQLLRSRQQKQLESHAAPVYLSALDRLQITEDHIPQCSEVSERLLDATGWQVVPVPALIDFPTFFDLLARKRFPAASFIRSLKDMDYLPEPDIFHEILGHTPLLTDPDYASFVEAYGKAGCRASQAERVWLARLFWFTVEFGLLNTDDGIKAFGAGIVSSRTELPYSVEDPGVERRPFDEIDILRTPYRIDQLQPVYFVLDSFEQLLALGQKNLIPLVNRARSMGLKPSAFERKAS
jgi:phenylalanine-4-hydroxylase